MSPWMHTAGLIVVRIVLPVALVLVGLLLLWYGVGIADSDPGIAWVMMAVGGAGALLSLFLLWRLNNARGREDFRWYVVPENDEEDEDAAPLELLSDEDRERLTRELAEVNRRWREALEAGFLSGGSLAAHEIRAELEERATALRQRLEAPSTRED
ncbi:MULTISPECIES: hypothetical protein [Microbacterium]|uniref:hypothetical protein n=1 Tax=Microbacterium TaxID=33882 RepID=UPI0028F0E142|nr:MULTISPECIES: hypothetical protein [Microbacterium]